MPANSGSVVDKKMPTKNDDRWIYGLLLLGAVLGLIASVVLSSEAIELARNPNAALSCRISLVVNCATVANHPSAQLLGFPNSFIGMVTLPVMLTIAVAGLGGVRFPRWFMRAAMSGAIAGLLFAGWMFYMSFFVIQALCPWCLMTDLGMIMVFFALYRYNVREGNCFSDVSNRFGRKLIARDYDKVAMVAVIMAVILAIVVRYGSELF